MKELQKKGLIDDSLMTVTGKSVKENLETVKNLDHRIIKDIRCAEFADRRHCGPLWQHRAKRLCRQTQRGRSVHVEAHRSCPCL